MKRKFTKWAFRIFLLLLLVSAGLGATTQPVDKISPPHRIPKEDISASMDKEFDSLSKIFGKNKVIPKGFEKQIIYALSFFPELIDTKIEFKLTKSTDGIISTRPFMGSVLKRSAKRTYLVLINDTTPARRMPSYVTAPVNGQVGILGHELCHIVYFNNRNSFGLIGLGVAHISTPFMDRFENKTDSMDIERGLGHQLISWVDYLHKGFRAMVGDNQPLPFEEKPGRERYMSVASIRRVMKGSEVYGK